MAELHVMRKIYKYQTYAFTLCCFLLVLLEQYPESVFVVKWHVDLLIPVHIDEVCFHSFTTRAKQTVPQSGLLAIVEACKRMSA